MAISVTRLTPAFAARIEGVDIRGPIDDGTWADIRAAFEEHSVLVFRGQPLESSGTTAASSTAPRRTTPSGTSG